MVRMGEAAKDTRIPLSRACLRVKKSYNQLRRQLALGLVGGGFDDNIGYYLNLAEVERLEAEGSPEPRGDCVPPRSP